MAFLFVTNMLDASLSFNVIQKKKTHTYFLMLVFHNLSCCFSKMFLSVHVQDIQYTYIVFKKDQLWLIYY